jgi:hypothetical protein
MSPPDATPGPGPDHGPVDPDTPGDRPPPSVVLHSSLLGLVSAALTPAIITAFGIAAVLGAGARPLTIGVLGLGLATTVAVLVGFPRFSRLDPAGITLVRVGRRQHIPWDDVTMLTRAPGTQSARTRALRQPPTHPGFIGPIGAAGGPDGHVRGVRPHDPDRQVDGEERPVSGGLVAHGQTRRRRWLLADQVESRQQFDAVMALLAALPTAVAVHAPRPHAAAPPTDLYRRRRH